MPNARTIDYVALIQEGIMTVENVPQDARNEVTKWLEHFQAPTKKEEVANEHE